MPKREAEPVPLAWSLREKLFAAFKHTFAYHGTSEHIDAMLALAVEQVAKTTGHAELARVAKGIGRRPLEKHLRAWLREAPKARRAAWLVDKLSAEAGLRWRERPAAAAGPMALPRKERERIARRFERLFERTVQRHDDVPEEEEYADTLDEEIERIARKNEAFAERVLTRRFPDRSGAITLPFHERLVIEAPKSADEVIAFFEKALDVEWSD
jgi:hypothetical protein